MDIEELNKFQLVLLTLLVSFVTSIATGIVTVTLLAEAPAAVTQTINQVVERTIETIVPKDILKPGSVKETTIVVKEDDLITSSIQASLGKTGRVYGGTATTSPVVGLAAQIGATLLITDSSIVDKDHLVSIGGATQVFSVTQRFPDLGIAILSLKGDVKLSDGFKIADVGAQKLGGTIIALVSVTQERVAIGAVASRGVFAEVAPSKDVAPIPIRAIDTNISAGLVPGTPLVNIFGDLIGVTTSVTLSTRGSGSFIATSDVLALMKATSQATSTPRN